MKLIYRLIAAFFFVLPPTVLSQPSPWTLRSFEVAREILAADTAKQEESKKDALIRHISTVFKRDEKLVRRIVNEVFRIAPKPNLDGSGKFPTALDVLAVIAQESKFDPKAEGLPGPSKGLMQIHVPSHGNQDWDNISVNVKKGLELLNEPLKNPKLHRAPHQNWALLAYNGGASYASRVCSNPSGLAAKCTSPYVQKVTKFSNTFNQLYRES